MKNKNFIKIISGKLKGLKIKTIKNKFLRPTTNIIKKILFNWINLYIKNKTCLDCFSGTGSLSIEAISNNAKYIIILEKNYKFFKNIKKNLNKIKKNKYKLININTFIWLKKTLNKHFDIIFIDPPYKKNYYLNKTLYLINKNKLYNDNTLIYIETYKKNNFINIPKNWKIFKKKYKQNSLIILIKRYINN